jgi:mitochondrial fission protein ELM1
MDDLIRSANPLSGAPAWIISDGKAGHENQCIGVARALGVAFEIKRVAPSGPFKWAAPMAPVAPGEKFGKQGSPFAPPWPAIAFATGRTTIPYIRALKRRAGFATFTVILMDPRTGPGVADLIWVPEHDRRTGANVIKTLTSPHGFGPDRLQALRACVPDEIDKLPHPRIAVLVGGPNRDYRYASDDQERFRRAIAQLVKCGAGLMITASRRTPEDLVAAIKSEADTPNCYFWDGCGDNPYADFLAHADAFVVTADSVNMACEAAATGRPIHIFGLTGQSDKFERFHASLQRYGASRALPETFTTLENWSYEPLDSAQTIADEIVRRWQARAAMIPGLMTRTMR